MYVTNFDVVDGWRKTDYKLLLFCYLHLAK